MTDDLQRPRNSEVQHWTGVYRMADHLLEIRSIYPAVHTLAKAYKAEGTPSLRIRTTPGDIARERAKTEGIRAFENASDAYLETLAVQRALSESLLEEGILLFHGSAVAVDGKGYVFAAKSGTGKSTHASLWRELLGNRVVMVNDDKPFLKIGVHGATVYGSPWSGKHRLDSNIAVPLRAICLLGRGAENRIAAVTAEDAWPDLWRQSYRPADPGKLAKTLVLVDTLSRSTHLYRMTCRADLEAARLAYGTMSRGG